MGLSADEEHERMKIVMIAGKRNFRYIGNPW
jgi:hypothetical protein